MLHRDLITPKPFIFWGYFFSCVLRDSHFDVVTQLTLERSSCVTPPPRDLRLDRMAPFPKPLGVDQLTFEGRGRGWFWKISRMHSCTKNKFMPTTSEPKKACVTRSTKNIKHPWEQIPWCMKGLNKIPACTKSPTPPIKSRKVHPLYKLDTWQKFSEKPMLRAAGPRVWNLKWDPRPYMWYQFLKGSTNIPASINWVPPSTSPTPRSP